MFYITFENTSTDPVDSVKIQDTKASIDNLSVKEVEYRQYLAELRNKLVAVKQNQLTKEEQS